jgi:hypothetical protein
MKVFVVKENNINETIIHAILQSFNEAKEFADKLNLAGLYIESQELKDE